MVTWNSLGLTDGRHAATIALLGNYKIGGRTAARAASRVWPYSALAPFASVERFPGAIFATARSGNPEPTSSDSARASEALSLFVSDTVACRDRNG